MIFRATLSVPSRPTSRTSSRTTFPAPSAGSRRAAPRPRAKARAIRPPHRIRRRPTRRSVRRSRPRRSRRRARARRARACRARARRAPARMRARRPAPRPPPVPLRGDFRAGRSRFGNGGSMNSKHLLTATALLIGIFGLGWLIAPQLMGAYWRMTPGDNLDYMGQRYAAFMLGLVVAMWMARNAPNTPARRALMIGAFFALAL